MAKTALKMIDSDEPTVTATPGIVRLDEGKLRVTFDIPEFEMCVIRRDRQIKVEYAQFTPEGLAKQFLYGSRFYNDAAGAAGKIDDIDEKGHKVYKDKDAFLDACKGLALGAYDKMRLGQFSKGRNTIGDPVEREMLKLAFMDFTTNGWTINSCPTEPGGKETSKCINADGKPDYKVFKERVEAYVARFPELYREDAEANLERQARRAKQIAEAAKDVQV